MKVGDIIKMHIIKDDPVIVRDIDEQYKLGDYFSVVQLLLEFGFIEEIPDKPKTIWNLKEGDRMYTMAYNHISGARVEEAEYSEVYESARNFGLIFLSPEEAEDSIAKSSAIQRIKKLIHDEGMEFLPDWNNQNQLKYWICYDHHLKIFSSFPSSSHHAGNLPPLKSLEDARKIIHAKSNELKIIFNIQK